MFLLFFNSKVYVKALVGPALLTRLLSTMATTRVISTNIIQAPSHTNGDFTQKIDLTPWDLYLLPLGTIQKGLLFHNPSNEKHISNSKHIQRLKHSFSTALSFFPPLAGRLVILQHEDNTASCHILCNNEGALFVHAKAENTTVADILQPTYVPHIVHSFFPLNGVKNYQGTTQPLLGVQVTELVDGVFIGCTINHVAADGKSFWHFINSWAEISRGLDKITKLPSLKRWLLDGIFPPIRFPFTNQHTENFQPLPPPLPERVFHFTNEKLAQLKSKANAEANTEKTISSLQAFLTHVWRSVIRAKGTDPQEEVNYVIPLGVRPRLVPPLPDDYFGNALMVCVVTMKAGELLLEGGLGKGALEMNKMIALHNDEKVKSHYESWARNPVVLTLSNIASRSSNTLGTSSSPRFDFYGNDFGWGKPVAVRSGSANKYNGKITVFGGAEEGSVDIEVCLPYEILEALGNDPQFIDAISV